MENCELDGQGIENQNKVLKYRIEENRPTLGAPWGLVILIGFISVVSLATSFTTRSQIHRLTFQVEHPSYNAMACFTTGITAQTNQGAKALQLCPIDNKLMGWNLVDVPATGKGGK